MKRISWLTFAAGLAGVGVVLSVAAPEDDSPQIKNVEQNRDLSPSSQALGQAVKELFKTGLSQSVASLTTPTSSTLSFSVLVPSNLNIGDSVINITNAGTSGGNICANVYTFSPDEQLISCCSCVVTPNALVSLSANSDLVSNTLSAAHPTSIVVKILATQGTGCNATNAPVANLAAGLLAWGTTLHAAPTTPVTYQVTETAFSPAGLSAAELERITSFCGFIQANGSGFGICKSCRLGGLGASFQ